MMLYLAANVNKDDFNNEGGLNLYARSNEGPGGQIDYNRLSRKPQYLHKVLNGVSFPYIGWLYG